MENMILDCDRTVEKKYYPYSTLKLKDKDLIVVVVLAAVMCDII